MQHVNFNDVPKMTMGFELLGVRFTVGGDGPKEMREGTKI